MNFAFLALACFAKKTSQKRSCTHPRIPPSRTARENGAPFTWKSHARGQNRERPGHPPYTASYDYGGPNDSAAIIASELANAFNNDSNSPVYAWTTGDGSILVLSSRIPGAGPTYSLSTSIDWWDWYHFNSSSATLTASANHL